MNIRQLELIENQQGCFSLQQLQLYEPKFLRNNIVRWIHQGYLQRVSKGWYRLASKNTTERDLFSYSNTIYQPSYVSMESALRYYDLIPEGVFMTTACTTKKTQTLRGDLGQFYYYHLTPSLFRGYTLVTDGGSLFPPFLIAQVEKTLCDFFYLKSHLLPSDIPGLRIDSHRFRELTNKKRLLACAKNFHSERVQTMVDAFISLSTE